MSIYLSICLYVYLFIWLSIYLFVRLSINLFVCLSINLFVCWSFRLSVFFSLYPSNCLSVIVSPFVTPLHSSTNCDILFLKAQLIIKMSQIYSVTHGTIIYYGHTSVCRSIWTFFTVLPPRIWQGSNFWWFHGIFSCS